MLYSHTMRVFVAFLLAAACLLAGEEQERNKAAARAFIEQAWIQGRTDAPEAAGQERVARAWCVVNGECSQSAILWQAADGERVATYWMLRQTPKRPVLKALAHLFGRVPLERPILTVMRFEKGRIVEGENVHDDLALYAGMGLVNALIVFVFALGGACGIALVWVMNKVVRKS